MGKFKYIVLLIILGMMVTGCAYHGIKQETGKEIDETMVAKIVKGKTASSEILAWFGAPTTNVKLGDDELFVYKYCQSTGGSFAVSGLGSTRTKEKCNELSITFDKSTGKVKDYGYQKQLED